MADDVLIETHDGVAKITLNRPESLNAMGGALMPMLAQYLSDVSSDRSVRCVVLTGAGRAFCAGGDVKGMAAGRDILTTNGSAAAETSAAAALAAGVQGLRASQRATSLVLHTMPKPTIAMVNGHAVGAGLSLALACDIRVASENAKLGTIFRNVGFSGDFGGSYFLQKLVGTGKARELYFTGEVLSAADAMAIGMVNRVVPHERLEVDDGTGRATRERPDAGVRAHEGKPEPRRRLRPADPARSGSAQHVALRSDHRPPRGGEGVRREARADV